MFDVSERAETRSWSYNLSANWLYDSKEPKYSTLEIYCKKYLNPQIFYGTKLT